MKLHNFLKVFSGILECKISNSFVWNEICPSWYCTYIENPEFFCGKSERFSSAINLGAEFSLEERIPLELVESSKFWWDYSPWFGCEREGTDTGAPTEYCFGMISGLTELHIPLSFTLNSPLRKPSGRTEPCPPLAALPLYLKSPPNHPNQGTILDTQFTYTLGPDYATTQLLKS